VRLLVCGVRGSTPAPGPDFVRYGGNTSCIAVLSDDDEHPRLVLDAGTGLQRLSKAFGGDAIVGSIIWGQLHWDHTHGLPFVPAGYQPNA
jgi:phosphoribosyl 1,2-cyclic phosphodiesterase